MIMNPNPNSFHRFSTLLFALSLFAYSVSFPIQGDVFVKQDFDFDNGSLVETSNGNWIHQSGKEGDLRLMDAQLHLQSSASEDASIPLGEASFSGIDNVHLYAKFRLKVTGLPTPKGAYFAHFRGGSSSTFRGRLFILASENGQGFHLGVSNGSSLLAVDADRSETLVLNREYYIVIRYATSTAQTLLGIDPEVEEDLNLAAADMVVSRKLNQFAFRQNPGMGSILIDDLVISDSFAELFSLTNQEGHTLRVESETSEILEGDINPLKLSFHLDGPLEKSLKIDLEWRGTALPEVDYTVSSSSIVFETGARVQELLIQPIHDVKIEGTELIALEISSDIPVTFPDPNTLRWSIVDDDLEHITFSASTSALFEDETFPLVILLERSGNGSLPLEVHWSLAGTAAVGEDFGVSEPFSSFFAMGQTQLEIPLEIYKDTVPEKDERIEWILNDSRDYSFEPVPITIDIFNDDYLGLLFKETFDYENGSLIHVSKGLWNHGSGPPGDMMVYAGQLDVNQKKGEDALVSLPSLPLDHPQPVKEIFIGVDILVTKGPEGEGNCLAYLSGNDPSQDKGRIFLRKPETGQGDFEVGISNGQSRASAWFPKTWNAPMRLRVIIGYDAMRAQTRLWVNPLEPDAFHVNASDDTPPSRIHGMTFSQGQVDSHGMGRFLLDHLVISTDWQDVAVGNQNPVIHWACANNSEESAWLEDRSEDDVKSLSLRWPLNQESGPLLLLKGLQVQAEDVQIYFTIAGQPEASTGGSIAGLARKVMISNGTKQTVLEFPALEGLESGDVESIRFNLVNSDAYQVGYPSEVVFSHEESTNAPHLPLRLSIQGKDPVATGVHLVLEGQVGQGYVVHLSQDLKIWHPWRSGVLKNMTVVLLSELPPRSSMAFYKVTRRISGMTVNDLSAFSAKPY
jgi:hypothetical protein